MASGSGAVGVSPSGASLVRGSTDSMGEPGGKSEQELMVRARRRCWPICVRFLEKLFLFLEPFTLAGFNPGSSFTSRSGCMTTGESAVSGVAGGSSLMSLRPPTSDLTLPILSSACSLRFSRFSIRAKACRMASIFLSSRVCREIEVGFGGGVIERKREQRH